MSTALVHDYLLVMRGAERTFASMADCWPDSDIYTLLYDAAGTKQRFEDRNVTTSYVQNLRLRQGNFRKGILLFPRAVETLPLQDHDVIVSSSSAFAHGVTINPAAMHVCYCHSPFRYVWHERHRGAAEVPPMLRPYFAKVLERIRRWDLNASRRVDHYIANSQVTRRRIQEFYGRDAVVIHPPVETHRFAPEQEPQDYLLMVSEIVRHKRIDVALEAAKRAGQKIKIVGTGPDLELLEHRFQDSAEFLGRVSDDELPGLYAGAKAFVMANVEEFGIAAVEAQAAGRPVVAAAAGGALETVIPGETGVLFPEDDVDALAEALRHTDFTRFSPQAIRHNAERFSVRTFQARLLAEVEKVTGEPASRPRSQATPPPVAA